MIKLHIFLQSQVASPSYRTHRALLKLVRLQLLMQHGWWSGGKAHTSMAACHTRFQTIQLSVVTSTKYDKCIKVSAALRLDLQQSQTASQSCRSVAIWHTGKTDIPTCWTSKPQSTVKSYVSPESLFKYVLNSSFHLNTSFSILDSGFHLFACSSTCWTCLTQTQTTSFEERSRKCPFSSGQNESSPPNSHRTCGKYWPCKAAEPVHRQQTPPEGSSNKRHPIPTLTGTRPGRQHWWQQLLLWHGRQDIGAGLHHPGHQVLDVLIQVIVFLLQSCRERKEKVNNSDNFALSAKAGETEWKNNTRQNGKTTQSKQLCTVCKSWRDEMEKTQFRQLCTFCKSQSENGTRFLFF